MGVSGLGRGGCGKGVRVRNGLSLGFNVYAGP
jgi:hypothetical protein